MKKNKSSRIISFSVLVFVSFYLFQSCKKDIELENIQYFKITNNSNKTIDSVFVYEIHSTYGNIPKDNDTAFSILNKILPLDTTEYIECNWTKYELIIYAYIDSVEYYDEVECPIDPESDPNEAQIVAIFPGGSYNILINEFDTINNYVDIILIKE